MAQTAMSEEQWHLDKRVPITLIFTILAQTLAVGWFVSNLASRVEANTAAISRLSQTATAQDERVRLNTTAISRVEETLRNIEKTLERINNNLDTLESRQ